MTAFLLLLLEAGAMTLVSLMWGGLVFTAAANYMHRRYGYDVPMDREAFMHRFLGHAIGPSDDDCEAETETYAAFEQTGPNWYLALHFLVLVLPWFAFLYINWRASLMMVLPWLAIGLYRYKSPEELHHG